MKYQVEYGHGAHVSPALHSFENALALAVELLRDDPRCAPQVVTDADEGDWDGASYRRCSGLTAEQREAVLEALG